ncbi:MAG: LysM peptidoglycan-binding domain-containing protein [Lachnospiraceae bacterium]|nr:LysM peptidoglycan-binding domain-containing protein [Lachnospiraceae bacterium]
MEHNFEYRQKARQVRLEERRRAAFRRRVRLLTTVCTFTFLFISIISANAIIANAGDGYEKNYVKMYTSVVVEHGDTVWDIATEYAVPGYTTVTEVMEEVKFINGLDDAYSIQTGSLIIIPFYAEN